MHNLYFNDIKIVNKFEQSPYYVQFTFPLEIVITFFFYKTSSVNYVSIPTQ